MEIKDIIDKVGQMVSNTNDAIRDVSSAIREATMVYAASKKLSYPWPKRGMHGITGYYHVEPVE